MNGWLIFWLLAQIAKITHEVLTSDAFPRSALPGEDVDSPGQPDWKASRGLSERDDRGRFHLD